ncbi:porin family protein [Flavobacterium sp.]|uniref:porin family protein n=1 Tax=Flavobacterium sp. TaxID=239 RepID=UPI003C3499A4
MKKIILPLFILVFTISHAQDLKFGIKAGLNTSFSSNDVKSKIGYQFGGFLETKINDKFSIENEVMYRIQEVKKDNIQLEYGGVNFTGEGQVKLSYLYFPVLLKYYATKNTFIKAGPQVAILLNANAKGEVLGSTVEREVKQEFENLDFGLDFGAGYEFKNAIAIEIRYYVGLTKMTHSDYVSDFYNRNSLLSLMVGYTFN